MDSYKKRFIDFLLKEGALKIEGEFKLKSGRVSPYFFNAGEFSSGRALSELGRAYADAILSFTRDFDVVFGPAYKGIPLAVSTAMALAEKGHNVKYAFDRKEAKNRGEATADKQKEWIVGSELRSDSRLMLVDDVITTGAAKYEALDLLQRVAPGAHIAGLVVAVDRQEVGDSQTSALEEFVQKSRINTRAIITALEIHDYCREKGLNVEPMKRYLLMHGSESAKDTFHGLGERFSKANSALTEGASGFFKYPGSVGLYGAAGKSAYRTAGITAPEQIAELLDNDIWPTVVAGSRSQGQSTYGTNFALDGYVSLGITDPKVMLALRNESITIERANAIRKKNPHAKDIAEFVQVRDELFGRPEKKVERRIEAYW
ncbi:orotate phosphoribosyltransferase [Candidatus Woesearchaeota archaeon]|nr:orotate phosphoribosyltransferase [Candidatus Woesearchaeota archaeon]